MLIVKCLLWLQFMQFLLANEAPTRQFIYWESFQPGQLLQHLKQLTDDIDSQPMQPEARIMQRMDNVAASSNYDYDRAYDDFVRKYFGDSVNAAFPAENSDSSMEQEMEEEDALSEASRTSQQHCRQVRKKREVCKICRNKSTGEKSETCTYASENAPREYARKYKKTRQSNGDEAAEDNNDEDEDEDEEGYEDEVESGSCTRLQKHGRVCYFCINSAGEKIKECTKLTNTSKRRAGEKNDKLKKSQRIYKRKVSFVPEHTNNTLGNVADETEVDKKATTAVVTKAPNVRKKVIVKVLKRMKTSN